MDVGTMQGIPVSRVILCAIRMQYALQLLFTGHVILGNNFTFIDDLFWPSIISQFIGLYIGSYLNIM